MYSKRGKTLKKRILSAALSLALVVPMFSCVTPNEMKNVNAATLPANPRVSGGVTTWDCVYFGRYQQSDATGVKKDAIKWRVLQVSGNDAFLMADCNLDTQQFNSKFEEYEWSQSLVRSWLNGYNGTYNAYKKSFSYSGFFNRAFTASEQDAIITTNVSASPNPALSISTSMATSDKVFILSYQEATNSSYGFAADTGDSASRVRLNTAYVAKGGYTNSNNTKESGKSGKWWLRTPGFQDSYALYVSEEGSIPNNRGSQADWKDLSVCPAIHLDISKTNLWSYAGTVGSDGKITAGDNPPSVDTAEQVVSSEEDTKYVKIEDENGENAVEYRAADSTAENVEIPATILSNAVEYKVTSIASGTYKNNKNLKTVIIGDNVTQIGDDAFSGCTNLQTVVIGKNVKTIGAKAFYKCTKLKKIIIPATVNKIGKQAFFGCKNLKSINIKTTKLTGKNVGAKAFKGTHKKATFKIPKKKLSAYKKLLKSKGASKKAKFKK